MVITLYTSRIILNALGIDDYGLYNVVGGVVAMLSFLNTAMTAATQRFITFELGKENSTELNSVFSTSLAAHLFIACIIAILAELIGVWFLNTYLQIPDGRLNAANWVFQCTILILCFDVLSVPYIATIIAHEKMTFYAVINIIDAILKLSIALLIQIVDTDRLIFYALLLTLCKIAIFFIYRIVCLHKFAICHYTHTFRKEKFKQLFSFSGWALLGQVSVVSANQGTNILINIFYSVVANASMGIASQVNVALSNLVSNFQKAFEPQITKSYAANDSSFMLSLVCRSAKISFFLLYIASIPVIFNINTILTWWLNIVPEYAGTFCVLSIICSLVNSISGPLWISVFATGKIRSYQIAISSLYLSDIILVYVFFKMGFSPTSALYIKLIINLIVIGIRLIFASKIVTNFSYWSFVRNAILPILLVTLLSLSIILPVYKMTLHNYFWSNIFFSIAIIAGAIYMIGIDKEEKKLLSRGLYRIIRK
jgi:O-antigen/teichoic acid export membrane protein